MDKWKGDEKDVELESLAKMLKEMAEYYISV